MFLVSTKFLSTESILALDSEFIIAGSTVDSLFSESLQEEKRSNNANRNNKFFISG
jgi:hypothetical protein